MMIGNNSNSKKQHSLAAISYIFNIRQSIFGMEYLQELISRFSSLYDMEYALIGKAKDNQGFEIESELLIVNGVRKDNICYELAGSPCEKVLHQDRICHYEQDVSKIFPDDVLLQHLGVSAYMGATLISPEGRVLGILVFMSKSPVTVDESMTMVMDFVASRVGMELEREELNLQIQQNVEQQNREKRLASLGQLSNGIAHDFNNLLAAILGHAELLERYEVSESAQPHVAGILNSVMLARNLTRELMDFSNPKVNSDAVTDLASAVSDLKNLVAPKLNDNIQITTEIACSAPVKIDGGHLQQILLNLTLNAIDAMPDGGEIKISAELVDDYQVGNLQGADSKQFMRMCVGDNGSGISKADREHIFDPFYTTKVLGKGAGLGLASVHSIVQSYGGTILLCGSKLEGCEFEIQLPIAEPKVVPAQGDLPPQIEAKAKLLVAEDNESILSTLEQRLKLSGFDVTCAPDGDKALKLLQQQSTQGDGFDLVIADHNMPGLTGIELLRCWQRNQSGAKFIISTGVPSALDTLTNKERQSCDYIVKPYEYSALLAMINDMLGYEKTMTETSAVMSEV